MIDSRTSDNTEEIAREFTDKIYHFDWSESFSEMKNFAASMCSHNWVFHLGGAKTLEEGGIEKMRSIIHEHGDAHDSFLVKLVSKTVSEHSHYLPHLYRKDNVEYSGAIHEVITDTGFYAGDVVITWGQNPNHKADPDRNMRNLKKEVAKITNGARWKFYLAREYYYRNDWEKSFNLFSEYIKISKFKAEKGDAYLLASKCLFQLGRGNEAREHCLRSIEINPDHEEALRFMADLHYEPWKRKWLQFADMAENNGVLFVVKRANL